ncbi:MAG: hypothetical protein IJW67_06415 [Blautia sp.]|nr:hypothetical protein [Blautia sp.]
MNPERDFIGGIYWGRFLYNDLYDTLTAEEIIGSMVANGISGYTSYGICGMDDGGLLHRMGKPFLESLKRGNLWMQQTIPQLGKRVKSQIAVLFPTAMAAFETMLVQDNKEKRLDLLGWYRMCCDLGYTVDVIDKNRIQDGALQDVKVLIVPVDDCYWLEPDNQMEKMIRDWVNHGGILLHGPEPQELFSQMGVLGRKRKASPVKDRKEQTDVIMVQGPVYAEFEGEVLADFIYAKRDSGFAAERNAAEGLEQKKLPTDRYGAITSNIAGKGKIYSFGFLYG